jgi:hypothetical protein
LRLRAGTPPGVTPRSGDEAPAWRSKLPRRLGAASSLDIRVSYERAGYASFVVGIARQR